MRGLRRAVAGDPLRGPAVGAVEVVEGCAGEVWGGDGGEEEGGGHGGGWSEGMRLEREMGGLRDVGVDGGLVLIENVMALGSVVGMWFV